LMSSNMLSISFTASFSRSRSSILASSSKRPFLERDRGGLALHMVLEDVPRPTSKHGLAFVALNLFAAATRDGCLCRHALVPYCRLWGSN
jgi:hypothetical protein